MKKLNSILAFSLVVTLSACQLFMNCEEGEGNIVKKEISIENFDEITLEGNYQLFISQGESQKVFIETYENLIPLINKNVSRGEWKIDFDPCVKSNKTINIYATVVNLKELNIEGAGSVKGETII